MYAERFMELRDRCASKIEAEMVRQHRANIIQANEVVREGLKRARTKLIKGEDNTPAGTAQKAASSSESTPTSS